MPETPQEKSWPHPRYKDRAPSHRGARHSPYTELQVTSNFSFLRGASHPEEYIAQAAALGYSSLALTDLHSVAGIVRAFTAAKQQKFPFIVGCALHLLDTLPGDTRTGHARVLVYPTSRAAYGRLCSLLTIGKRRAPKGSCYLVLEDLLAHHEELLCVLPVTHLHREQLEKLLRGLRLSFEPERLSLGVVQHYEPANRARIELARELSQLTGTPLVALNDVHYHVPERRELQDVLTCIRLGTTIQNARHALFPNGERYLKPPEEMARLFRHLPEALSRSNEIAERALQFSLDELRYEYPAEICPDGRSPLEYLTALTWKGAAQRFPDGVTPGVAAQIRHELALIQELHYEKYFLTVYDIVAFARSRDILCQGRGAAANSAVCYCLGITSVDPSRINILFERFISKERNEPPDIDVDFEHERREEVIQYIYNKYGRHRAALVAEVISYRARSAIRDVGKAFGLSLDAIEALSRVVSSGHRRAISSERLAELGINAQDPTTLVVLRLAREILGFPRHLSQHVGGFVITAGPLSEIVPVENAAMEDRTVIEWDKDDIEVMGMLKIDILGLGMLTCIRKAFHLINDAYCIPLSKELLKLHTIPAEDARVYDMICRADTVGVFQIESRAQMSMLPRLKPRCFYDLVIEVAIVRPGPIQGNMVHPYLRRRSGREKITYPNEDMKRVLERTLGVPLFQEQAMQLAIVGAGFTPGEADNLRRAIASWKKKSNLMEEFGKRIVAGMIRNGYPSSFAQDCFEQIKGFGEYGFPESHAASFALLVYVSAWLKCHYPAAFAAGLLNSQPMGFYQPAQIVQDAQRHGVTVEPIDVNYSRWDCTLEGPKHYLRLGLRMVRGLQETEAELLVRAVREHGPFDSIAALWRRSGARVATLRLLARADAFRSIGLSRQQALWSIRKLRDAPLPLFEHLADRSSTPDDLPFTPLQAEVLSDYERTGLSLKKHPLAFLRRELDVLGARTAANVQSEDLSPRGTAVSVCGMVLVRQQPGTASGVVFVTLEDETGIVNLIVRPHIFAANRATIAYSSLLFASGQIERQGEVVHVLVESVRDFSGALAELQPSSRDFH